MTRRTALKPCTVMIGRIVINCGTADDPHISALEEDAAGLVLRFTEDTTLRLNPADSARFMAVLNRGLSPGVIVCQ